MKYNMTLRFASFSKLAVCIVMIILCEACENDSIVVSSLNKNTYVISEEALMFVTDFKGKSNSSTIIELRDKAETGMIVSLSKSASTEVKANLKYDSAVLQSYNDKNGSNYKLFPESSLSFKGDISIPKGAKKSDIIEITVNSNDLLDNESVYAAPLKAEIISGDVKLSKDKIGFLILVKNLIKMPSAEKESGLKIISIMEVNDTNPLNNLCFTLKDSNKPLVDMVVLFSANINYDLSTGRVYVYNNENVQHLLDNREKYIKPLQDVGIKVILGILGNHDRSGIANLADNTAGEFAGELKNVIEAYKLDGVFFDDEYSRYQYSPPPGFVQPSSDAASRLCYEVKQSMPDKLVCVYVYGRTRMLPDVDGHKSGEFVDYGIHDYGRGADLSYNYPNMPKSNMIMYSQEFNRRRFAYPNQLDNIVNNGYGGNMIFAMSPFRPSFPSQLRAMRLLAEKFYDEELVYNGKPYPKDW